MSPHTPTLPPTDRGMWRKLLARTHPDTGGDHDLFVWARELREIVATSVLTKTTPPRPATDDRPRVPFAAPHDFDALEDCALRAARHNSDNVYGYLLSLLEGCYSLPHMDFEEQRGASYRRLAAIGHTVGMSKSERCEWYRVAESIPLSDRFAGHILSKLKRGAA